MPTPNPVIHDEFTFRLVQNVQEVIKLDPSDSAVAPYRPKQLLLLITKPEDAAVRELIRDPIARQKAHELYSSMQQSVMSELSSKYNNSPPPWAPAYQTREDLPPSYEDACTAYLKHTHHCKKRAVSWCSPGWQGDYYYTGYPMMYPWEVDLMVHGVEFATYLTMHGIDAGLRGVAEIGTAASGGGCGGNCDGEGCLFVVAAVVVFAVSVGLITYAINELMLALQEDSDLHSHSRKLSVVLPTLLLTAGAGYAAFAYLSLLTGLTISTGGLALAVFAAVSVTAASMAFISSQLMRCATSSDELTWEEVDNLRLKCPGIKINHIENSITQRTQQINKIGYTFFCCNEQNDKLRQLRREIYNLKTHGDQFEPLAPPSYAEAVGNYSPA